MDRQPFMNRRDFFRRAAVLAAGAVAADQLELLEKLMHKKVWTGFGSQPKFVHHSFSLGFEITDELLMDDIYTNPYLTDNDSWWTVSPDEDSSKKLFDKLARPYSIFNAKIL